MPENLKRLPREMCMKKMISYLANKHPDWAHDQVVAVAASECGISTKNDYALETGTRVALRLNEYKKNYAHLDLKRQLAMAYHDITRYQDFDTLDSALESISREFNDFTQDAYGKVGRPRNRGLKPQTSGAMVSGAKRTKVGQSLKKAGVPLEASGQPTVTMPFSITNTETGEIVQGQVHADPNKQLVQMAPLSSSNAKSSGVQGDELVVAFQENNESKFYRYQFQNHETAVQANQSLRNSGSPGRWIWHNMRGHKAGEKVTPQKIGPSLEAGKPTIGGTSSSLVNYKISKTAPSRVAGYKEATEKLQREESNPIEGFESRNRTKIETSLQNVRAMRDKGSPLFKNLQQRGITAKADLTVDSTSMSGILTRSGEFDYRVEGGGIKTKVPENLQEIVNRTEHVPVYGRRTKGSHQEAENTLIGFAHDLKFIPKGKIHEDYAFIHGGVEFFYDIEDLSDLEDPNDLSVSFGFEDGGDGYTQDITKLHHLAVSLNNLERDRCSTMDGPSCTINKDDPIKQILENDFTMKGVIKLKMTKINHDQNQTNDMETNDALEILQADLKTKLGDGELMDIKGKLYYKISNEESLYSIDFDAPDQQTGDNLPQIEAPMETQAGTDLKKECPLSKTKTKSENDMTVKETEKAGEQLKENDVDADMKDDNTKEISKTDPADKPDAETPKKPKQMDFEKEPEKEEKPAFDMEQLKDFIANVVADQVKSQVQDMENSKKIDGLRETLSKEPYGLSEDMLNEKTYEQLAAQKDAIEATKLFKDFQASEAKKSQKEISPEISKEIFADFEELKGGNDPWITVKGGK